MTALALNAFDVDRGRGRPSNAELTRSLERARLVNISLREQLRVERREGVELATGIRRRGLRTSALIEAGLLVEARHESLGMAAAADRHVRQRSQGAHV